MLDLLERFQNYSDIFSLLSDVDRSSEVTSCHDWSFCFGVRRGLFSTEFGKDLSNVKLSKTRPELILVSLEFDFHVTVHVTASTMVVGYVHARCKREFALFTVQAALNFALGKQATSCTKGGVTVAHLLLTWQ